MYTCHIEFRVDSANQNNPRSNVLELLATLVDSVRRIRNMSLAEMQGSGADDLAIGSWN